METKGRSCWSTAEKTDWDHDDDLCYYPVAQQNSKIVSLSSVAVLWLLTDENKLRNFILVAAQKEVIDRQSMNRLPSSSIFHWKVSVENHKV